MRLANTLRIGVGAGYSGDRIPPALELAERGELDYLVFECLAERTIALAQLQRSHDARLGFDSYAEPERREALDRLLRTGQPVVTMKLLFWSDGKRDVKGFTVFVPT